MSCPLCDRLAFAYRCVVNERLRVGVFESVL